CCLSASLYWKDLTLVSVQSLSFSAEMIPNDVCTLIPLDRFGMRTKYGSLQQGVLCSQLSHIGMQQCSVGSISRLYSCCWPLFYGEYRLNSVVKYITQNGEIRGIGPYLSAAPYPQSYREFVSLSL